MCKEYEDDAPFVSVRRDNQLPSFCVSHYVYTDYFLVVRPANDDLPSFLLARAFTNFNFHGVC